MDIAVESIRVRPRVAVLAGLVGIVMALAADPLAASRSDLARALSLYNQGRFDQAIEAATAARKSPDTQDAAAVVLARAHLERYRERVDPADLSAAREALGAVRSGLLEPRERLDYLVTLGQALFLEDEFGAAAHLFGSAVQSARELDLALADAIVDWWGSAVERQAEMAAPDDRKALFVSLADDMRRAQSGDPESAASAYWIAAALRGAGDAMGAWHAATAGWVRARLAGARAANLRADLDMLVLQGIIPDRVRSLTPTDRAVAESRLRADWELVKERWR